MNDKQWLTREWHIIRFNSGYEIRYLDDLLVSQCVPFDIGDDGITRDFDLVQYLVLLHNRVVRDGSRSRP